jgi:hypothetical protein
MRTAISKLVFNPGEGVAGHWVLSFGQKHGIEAKMLDERHEISVREKQRVTVFNTEGRDNNVNSLTHCNTSLAEGTIIISALYSQLIVDELKYCE